MIVFVRGHEKTEMVVGKIRRVWRDDDGSVLYDVIPASDPFSPIKLRVEDYEEWIFRRIVPAIRRKRDKVIIRLDAHTIEWGDLTVKVADIE